MMMKITPIKTREANLARFLTWRKIKFPYPAEFLKCDCPPFIFRTVHYQFWGNQDKNLMLCSQTVYSLVRLHRSTGSPGSILEAKANYFLLQKDKG